MPFAPTHRLCLAVSLVLWSQTILAATSTPVAAIDGRTSFLTAPTTGDQRTIALDYLTAVRPSLGLTEADLADMVVRDDYETRDVGMRHLVLRQHHAGIPVFNGDISINIARDGSIINLHNGFVADIASNGALLRAPRIAPVDALINAAKDRGIKASGAPSMSRHEGGTTAAQTWDWPSVSADPIPLQLMFQPSEDRRSARLVWDLVIRETRGSAWWSMRVDATSGEVVDVASWIAHERDDARSKDLDGPTGMSNQYLVYAFPVESPDQASQSLVTMPADNTASPFGWHDTNGAAGAEFTTTRGNNVSAQDDLDANDSGGFQPDGGASLTFNVPHVPANDPAAGTNLDASIINLFYWNNMMHDVTYHKGFDEAAGNFQENNYGRGGLGADSVNADAIDGVDVNNANFGTPPDGFRPRMQMFRWSSPLQVTVNTPPAIAGVYRGAPASFGAAFDVGGNSGNLTLVNDGTAPVTDGCSAMPAGSLSGQIAVIDRGGCEFGVKGLNAQNAGAIGIMVVNNTGGFPGAMGPGAVGSQVTIRSFMIGQADGNAIKAQLPTPGVNITSRPGTDRDSDFDAGIIAHEYGHGISNRLTGGPSNVSCLQTNIAGGQTSEQGGEGWSDMWALFLHASASDTRLTRRFIGTYSAFHPISTGPGIRNFPYSTDPAVSPQTYANVATTNAPHGVGEIWAGALWNMYWQFVDTYGFDSNKFGSTGGNNIAMQLIVDGMKLQPCSPTMVQARDAILQADLNRFNGDNVCRIWDAFAAKGLGVNAVGGAFARGDEVADFTTPLTCDPNYVFHNGFE